MTRGRGARGSPPGRRGRRSRRAGRASRARTSGGSRVERDAVGDCDAIGDGDCYVVTAIAGDTAGNYVARPSLLRQIAQGCGSAGRAGGGRAGDVDDVADWVALAANGVGVGADDGAVAAVTVQAVICCGPPSAY